MSDKQARLHAVSEWLMEFSVLWAVFPLLDELLADRPMRLGLIAIGVGIAAIAATGGILLRKGEPK